MILTMQQNKRSTVRETQMVSGKTKEGDNSQILKGMKNKGVREEGRQTDLT